MKNDTDVVVELDGVTKHYPGAAQPALKPTTLTIGRGEFFSVLGPSGSGKTTTLRLIAGFETPDSGRVVLEGRDVTGEPPYRRNVSTVFQSYALFPHMTVEANVGFPLLMARVPAAEIRSRTAQALDLVEMESFAVRYPHQMSGGQRQRVALARALVGKPAVLLLDEPLGALDLRLRQQMQHVLVRLQRELGITFIYVTHDQSEALSMSSRVAVVEGGAIRQLDTPQNIYFAPKDEFIARFIGKSNILDIAIEGAGAARTGVLGPFRFPLLSDIAPGRGRLSLRFESVEIVNGKLKPAKPLSLEGTISDVLFLGSVVEVKVQTKAGEILAHAPASRGSTFVPGADVVLGFDPADCSVFSVRT
jgi:spermidine/putrescine transport system ATP-binding protein